jgi:PAS domain S-box-containing protein
MNTHLPFSENLPQSRVAGIIANALLQVVASTSAIVAIKDLDGRYRYVNDAFVALLGGAREDYLGRTDVEIFNPAMAEVLRWNDRQVLAELREISFQEELEIDGQLRTFTTRKYPLRDREGATWGICLTAEDVTERRRTNEALHSIALGISAATGPKVFELTVSSVARALGVNLAFVSAIDPGQQPMQLATLALCANGQPGDNEAYEAAGTPCEQVLCEGFQYLSSDAQARFPADDWLVERGFTSYAGYPLVDSQGSPIGVLAVCHRGPLPERHLVETLLGIFAVRAGAELDRVRMDQALRESEASYRAIFEASDDCIFVLDIDTGAIVDVNPRVTESYGYQYDEVLRMRPGELGSGEPPYDEAGARGWFERAQRGEIVRFEWLRRNRDGSTAWDAVTLKRTRIAGMERILAVTRDISERKARERARERLELKLRQAQKMEAIGHLTGGIAHDFNNILTGIFGYLAMAADAARDLGAADLLRHIDRARHSGGRAAELIQQMLTFSRGQRGDPREIDPEPVLRDALRLVRSTLPTSVELEVDLVGGERVLADPVQIEQVLMNLCINGRDAMNGHGQLRISLRPVEIVDAVCTACQEPIQGRFMELAAIDSGPGVPEALLARIFDPFFSTKAPGQGSGMGLATVHGIVHEHGGHLLVNNEPQGGAAFRVLLPMLADGRSTPAQDAMDSTGVRPASRSIRPLPAARLLLVEDDATARELMRELLERAGLRVDDHADPLAALDAVDQGQAPDIALVDYTMPHMNGVELACRLRECHAALPVVLYSGFAPDLSPAVVEAAGIAAVLRKPVEPADLLAVIEALLPPS